MIALLLVYPLSAYLFSGVICYVACRSARHSRFATVGGHRSPSLVSLWIVTCWPMWMASTIDDNSFK